MKDLDVYRQGNSYPVELLRKQFDDHGIVVLKQFLPAESRDDLRSLLEQKLRDAATRDGVLRMPMYPKADFLLGDILSIRELERYGYIFFQRELLDVLRKLLDSSEVIYFGDSSVQFGEAARGFHKDNVDRYDGTREDWKTSYGLIRCGFYCQDHLSHSGGLKIRLSSHNIPIHTKGKIVDIGTTYGDVVLWNMRLTHSGNNKKLRLFSSVGLHPRLERILPASLGVPEQLRRISAFCAFGRPGSHLERYIESMNARSADYKAYFQRARKPQEASALLNALGISFKQPNEYYGEFD